MQEHGQQCMRCKQSDNCKLPCSRWKGSHAGGQVVQSSKSAGQPATIGKDDAGILRDGEILVELS